MDADMCALAFATPCIPDIGISDCSEDPLACFQSIIAQIFLQLEETADPTELDEYTKWLKNITKQSSSFLSQLKSVTTLKAGFKETNKLKQHLLKDAVSREKLSKPTYWGKLTEHSVDIDAFLFTNVNEYLNFSNLKSVNKCCDCSSSNVSNFEIVSHSASEDSLIMLYTFQLPSLEGKSVLDIGCGIGSILFGAFYFTEAKQITGIELNDSACKFLKGMTEKYCMRDRVKIVEGDFRDNPDLVKEHDVIILNNPFEYFLSEEQEKTMWCCLKSMLEKGVILVTNPGLEAITRRLDFSLDIGSWAKPLNPTIPPLIFKSFDETDEAFCVYEIV